MKKSFTDWKSVIAISRYKKLTHETGRFHAMRTFADRMRHLKLSETAQLPESMPPCAGTDVRATPKSMCIASLLRNLRAASNSSNPAPNHICYKLINFFNHK